LAAEREGQKGWRRFIKNGMWRRTFAGTSVQAWQQLSGANVMTYYVVYIFEMANLTGNTGLVSSGIQYAIFIVGTAATFFFIDKTGRRPLLVSASSAIVLSGRFANSSAFRFMAQLLWVLACSWSAASLEPMVHIYQMGSKAT
jgi:hypothetical protein